MAELVPIHGSTRVVGVFGDPIAHTLSPLMQNRAFAALGLPYVYVPWRVLPRHLPAAVEAVRALDLVGVNVTIPHKVAVMELLDEVTSEAQLIGAVNTIENRGGWLVGHNTDAPGFLRSLRESGATDPRGRQVMLLGAGGAARAIGVQMMLSGAYSLVVANRSPVRAEQLAGFLSGIGAQGTVSGIPLELSSAQFQAELGRAEILINTTSVGMYPHHLDPPIIPSQQLHSGLLVCDVVYIPRETALLSAAREAGCRTLPGLGMLVHQGAIAMEIWTGHEAPVALMEAALVEALVEMERRYARTT